MYLQTTQTTTLPNTIFILESSIGSRYCLSDEYYEGDEYDDDEDDGEAYYGEPDDAEAYYGEPDDADDFWDDSNDD